MQYWSKQFPFHGGISVFGLTKCRSFVFVFLCSFILMGGATACQKKKNTISPPSSAPIILEEKVLAQNLSHPWEILWGPDNFIWMTERGGRISRVNPGSGEVTPVYTIPDVQSAGEGGLLGMVLHPSFTANPHVYVTYNYNSASGYREKIVRFTYNGTTLTSPQIILDNVAAANIHNGSRLLIYENRLYVTTGDAAVPSLAQNTALPNGKVLRFNLDGSIPADNPIANNPVWSWGHRNAQGLTLVGNKLFASEHGPNTDDEINVIEKGRNYGWPSVRGFCNETDEQTFCTANNIKEPIKAWTPTIAAAGMDYYNSNYIPQWKNSLLVTALKNSRLYQVKLNDTQTAIVETMEFFANSYGRLRDVCVAPDGKVYFSSSNGSNDKIIVVQAKM